MPLPLTARSFGVGSVSICSVPRRNRAVGEASTARTLIGRALGDDVAAVAARARPEVDDPVGRLHRGLVVLDDQHGVAEVAQALERADQRPWSRGCRPIDGSSRT